MTLRSRLAAAFFIVLLGPVVLGAVLLSATTRGQPPPRHRALPEAADEAVRREVAALCQRLDAAARGLAISAAVRGERFAVTPAGVVEPWALCGIPPPAGSPPLGTRYGGLAARAEIRDEGGLTVGYAYAVQPLDGAFLAFLSAAAGVTVTPVGVGGAAVDVWQPLPLAVTEAPDNEGSLPAAVAAAIAVVLVAGALGWWLARVATRPLGAILGAVERVAGGDFTARTRVGGRDEAGRLGSGLDRLIGGMQEAHRLAVTDALTGLGNVRHLAESLRLEIERASRFGRALGVLLLDLDHFKEVNDAYGHRAGDAVLVEFARRIRGAVREVDLAFRQGGEEFVILLPETDVAGSVTVARRIVAAVRDAPFASGRRRIDDNDAPDDLIEVTVSIGVAVFPRHAASGSEVLDAADRALYAAKASGRDTFVLANAAVPGPREPANAPPPLPAGRPEVGGASGGTTPARSSPGGLCLGGCEHEERAPSECQS